MIKPVAATSLLSLLLLVPTMLTRAEAENPLETSMKHMGKAFKALVIDLKKPDESAKADYLALAATLKTEARNSRDQIPNKADNLPPDQNAAMVAAYQKSMDDFAASVDVLSQDIQGSQWDAANKQLALLKQSMFDGHKSFRKSEHDEAPPMKTMSAATNAAPAAAPATP